MHLWLGHLPRCKIYLQLRYILQREFLMIHLFTFCSILVQSKHSNMPSSSWPFADSRVRSALGAYRLMAVKHQSEGKDCWQYQLVISSRISQCDQFISKTKSMTSKSFSSNKTTTPCRFLLFCVAPLKSYANNGTESGTVLFVADSRWRNANSVKTHKMMVPYKGGPLPAVTGVITPISRTTTPVTPL